VGDCSTNDRNSEVLVEFAVGTGLASMDIIKINFDWVSKTETGMRLDQRSVAPIPFGRRSK
jgi:hypothetical protein